MKFPCDDCLCISVCKMKDPREVIHECSIIRDYFVDDLGDKKKTRSINAFIDIRDKKIYTGYKKSIKKFVQMMEILYRGTDYESFSVEFEGRFAKELPGTTSTQQSIIDSRATP